MANEFVTRKGLISLGGITFPYTGVTSAYSVGVNDYFIELRKLKYKWREYQFHYVKRYQN
jgi:hypothetical protein